MLRKVLKHDLGAIYKLWTILSISALVLGALSGVALRILMTPIDGAEHFTGYHVLSAIFLFIAILGIIAYILICYIFVIYRYYKNFFTDEGYLTFTLPVKRYTLLNSKLINAFIWETATGAVFILSIVLMLLIAPSDVHESGTLLSDIIDSIMPELNIIINFADGWFWAFVVAIILLSISSYIFTTLLVYMCVTIGCIVAKKAKALVAILVYYAANAVISMSSYLLVPLGSFVTEAITVIGADANPNVLTLLMLAALICASMFVLLLAVAEYKFILGRLENKLNLA